MPVKMQQRTQRLGLEVTERIVWEVWQPGGEYTKNITLKNVDVKSKKLKYKIPMTRFFTTKYPQPIVLSSGTSLNLPVTFRPLEKGKYEDQIVFETKDGIFSVSITAVLPEADLLLPEKVDFCLCAVGDHKQQLFEITNISDVEVSFNISCEKPFDMTPNTGQLLPHSRSKINVNFKPEGAFPYNFEAICTFGTDTRDSHSKKIQLQGTGKYAYIGVKSGHQIGHDITVNFKNVPLNTTYEKTVQVVNYTPVSTPFQVIQSSFDSVVDKVYKCSQYHGIVPGNGTIDLKISCTPSISDIQQADSFEILALGCSRGATINCIGIGKGPTVSLETTSINFGLINLSTSATKSFQIVNESRFDAFFQFQLDNECSVFNCDVTCGRLKGGTSRTIKVTFMPEKPISYYRKVTCLIHNQGILLLDLFGTCHSDQITPGVLHGKHIERYKIHNTRGLTRVPPEDLRSWLQEGRVVVGDDGCLNITDGLLQDELQQSETNEGPMEEYFNDGTIGELTTVSPHVSVDARYVEFARCITGQVYHKTINVTNHTQGKICCSWNSGKKGNPFSVQPAEFDVDPLQSASFSVRFKPNVPGQFYSAELEGFAFYKSSRDHCLVEDVTLSPPWCLTTIASGHTFNAKSETFLPQHQMDSSVVFAPVTSIQPSYKTLLLTNNGTNPVNFSFDDDDSRTFACKPSRGLLHDKYQIVVWRYLPDDLGVCKKELKCTMNVSEKYSTLISLIGSAEALTLQIQAKEVVYFQPTYIGTSTSVTVLVRNPCRVPLRFEWKIPAEDKEALSVKPESGIISSNETQVHAWSFKPKNEEKYFFKVKLIADSIDASSDSHRNQTPILRLIGEGQQGSLSCQPEQLDFGDVVVGNTVRESIHLQNESDCGLHFDLKTKEDTPGEFGDIEHLEKALQLSEYGGFLPARSRKSIEVKMHPQRRCRYVSRIYCELISSQEYVNNSDQVTDFGAHICTVTVNGVFPTLAINDIRGTGCAERYSRNLLWNTFSISRFNSCLDSDPASEELIYKVPTRHSTRRRMPVHTRAVLDFNFSSAPHLSEPCHVLINLQNIGSAPAEWTFLFPTDLQLDMEFWAQTGEMDDDELHEMFVLDHSLFSIYPKKGNLRPGQSQVISLSYSHSAIGVHKLPVLFKVSKGREVLLNFIGSTISPEERYLHFSTTKHMFDTVPIGRTTPPIQFFPLHNGGGQPVEFHLDISPLDEIQERNCGWRIFECLNPTGVIPPGQTSYVSWMFSPLEAKTYTVDIMVYAIGGESNFVSFTGIGYDPAVMGPTMALASINIDLLPKTQLISVPEQLVYLSEERITFDNLPLLSAEKRVVFLKNISKKFVVSFRWLLDSLPQSEVISIEPPQGYIEPSEYAPCKVTFFSKGPPGIYDLDCLCEIANETLMAKYNKELVQWHRMEDDKKVHFTITDTDAEKTRPNSGSSKLKSLEASKGINRSDSDLKKYDALPPIGIMPNDTSSANQSQPTPPDTFIVHMSFTARTHSIEEFSSSNFVDIADKFFIKSNSSKDSKDSFKTKLQNRSCSKEEHDTISTIIPLIIMDVLESKDFKDAIKTIQEEPIPYFGMLTSEISNDSTSPVEEVNLEVETEGTEGGLTPRSEPDARTSFIEKEERNQSEEEEIKREELKDDGGFTDDSQSAEEVSKIGNEVVEKGASGTEGKIFDKSTSNGVSPVLLEKQMLKNSEEFSTLLEEILENTIFNIISEASKREINLTARPRLVALPPSAKGRKTNT